MTMLLVILPKFLSLSHCNISSCECFLKISLYCDARSSMSRLVESSSSILFEDPWKDFKKISDSWLDGIVTNDSLHLRLQHFFDSMNNADMHFILMRSYEDLHHLILNYFIIVRHLRKSAM